MLRTPWGGRSGRRPAFRAGRYRPRLEPLEDRRVPAVNLVPGTVVNIGPVVGNQNQATLAIDPTSPTHIVAFANDEGAGGGFREYVSSDGGASWQSRLIANGDGNGISGQDPQAIFDRFGNLFVVFLDHTDKTHDAVVVLDSTDDGLTFTPFPAIASADKEGDNRPSIAAGSNSVWVAYRDENTQILASGATDNGKGLIGAFAKPEVATGSTGGDFSSIAVAPGATGQVVVTYEKPSTDGGPATIFVNRDQDGLGTVQGFGLPVTVTPTNVGGQTPIPPQPVGNIDAEPHLVYDQSNGIHRGRLYMVYTDSPAVGSQDTNVFVRISSDNGATWGAAVQVNDDTSGNSQFLPRIAVDRTNGDVAVAFYDARNDGSDVATETFAALSQDGGATWLPNVAVSDATSDATVAGSPNDYGRFFTMDFHAGILFPAWADNSNSTGDNPDGGGATFDIYTDAVTVGTTGNHPPVFQTLTQSATTAVESDTVTVSGTFTDADKKQAHTVVIDWGDGTAKTQISLAAGVTKFGPAGHAFEESAPGTPWTIQATVTDDQGASDAKGTTITVLDAPLSASAASLSPLPGTETVSGVIASFTDADPNGTTSDYTATITWGDGAVTPGTVAPNGSGGFNVSGTHAYAPGAYNVSVLIQDVGGSQVTANTSVTIPQVGLVVTGADAGGGPHVVVTDISDDTITASFYAYDSGFSGGVRVALGDVNGDGVPDIITAPGPGMEPRVRVFDGKTHALIRDFDAYDSHFQGGVFVAAADFDRDGFVDIVTGADAGGGPHLKVFSGKDGSVLFSFYAYSPFFQGGVRVAAGDVNGDGVPDLITGPGVTGGPDVRVFDGTNGQMLYEFMAYDSHFLAGIYVAAGDVNGDGKADIITGEGAAATATAAVNIFNGPDGAFVNSFNAYAGPYTDGVRVGVLNTAPGARAQVVVSAGPGPSQKLKVVDGLNGKVADSFFAYDPQFQGGVFVGGF